MYILDTHVLLWALSDSPMLSDSLKSLICEEEVVAVSIASLWEMAIKQIIGKLKIDVSLKEIEEKCYEKDILILPILPKELDILKTLPSVHGDPFDRLIICQAISNAAVVITKDTSIPKYPVRTLWK